MRRRKSRREAGGEPTHGQETNRGDTPLPLFDDDDATTAEPAPDAGTATPAQVEPAAAPVAEAAAVAPTDEATETAATEARHEAPAPDGAPVDEPAAGAVPADAPAAAVPRAKSKLDRARAAALAGETSAAIALYRELLVDQGRNTELRATLGMLYESRGQSELAIEQYEAVRDVEPENVENLIRLANAQASLNRFDAAERELRRAVKIDPTRPAAYSVLGVINFRRGLYAVAELELKRAIELDQHAALAYHYRGESLNQLGRVDEALAMLERAAQLQPGHARTYYVMGILFDKKNRPQEAAAMFRKAREITAA